MRTARAPRVRTNPQQIRINVVQRPESVVTIAKSGDVEPTPSGLPLAKIEAEGSKGDGLSGTAVNCRSEQWRPEAAEIYPVAPNVRQGCGAMIGHVARIKREALLAPITECQRSNGRSEMRVSTSYPHAEIPKR